MHSWHSPLTHLGVLSLSGQDAAKFLQGQATCDILGLPPGQTTLGALCTAKGRAIVVFRALRVENRLFLLMYADVLETVRKRLQTYVLRADVKITDVSHEWAVFGLCGEPAATVLDSLGLPPLQQDNEAEGQSGFYAKFYAVRIPTLGCPRFLLLADAAKATGLARHLEGHQLPRADAQWWRLENIRAGIPSVKTATVEEFVPQMLNLDLLGGISFKKGCYTGQEIIARTHYLGSIKRRMYRLHGNGPLPVAGQVLAFADGQGSIVDAVTTEDGDGFDALAVLPVALVADGKPLHTPAGEVFTLTSLPYAVADNDA